MDELTRLEKRLARYLGPIAKVMVRRGAKETTDIFVLAQQVASKIQGTAEREEFLKGTGVVPSRTRRLPIPNRRSIRRVAARIPRPFRQHNGP